MRCFVVIGHRVVTAPDFNLNDLAGSTGRLDVLLRCVNSALLLSHGVRRDTTIHLVLLGPPAPPKTISINGREVKYLNPDERSTGALIRNALIKWRGECVDATPGIRISSMGLEDVLRSCAEKTDIIYLREDGEDIRGKRLPKDCTFVLGDDRDLTSAEEETVMRFNPAILSLGPYSLHTHHCITLVHNEIDRQEKINSMRA